MAIIIAIGVIVILFVIVYIKKFKSRPTSDPVQYISEETDQGQAIIGMH